MSGWITLDDISNDLGIPRRTINFYKNKADFPPIYQFGKRHLRVKVSDYELWKTQKIINNKKVVRDTDNKGVQN